MKCFNNLMFGILAFFFIAKFEVSSSAPECKFPKGILNGVCVFCPVDTLYESTMIRRYTYMYLKPPVTHISYNCVEICSQEKPFISGRQCVSTCPGKASQTGNTKYCKDEGLNIGFCDVNNCPSPKYKCYYMQCFRKCPAFTVVYNDSCVIECFKEKPFVRDNECVRQCQEYDVIDNGVCRMNCSIGHYLSGRYCVDKCPDNQAYVDGERCFSECPSSKKIQDNNCVKNCSHDRVLAGRVCLKRCPSGLYEHKHSCVSSCPNNTLVENQTCIYNCSKGLLVSDGKCVAECPSEHFISGSENMCSSTCDGFKFYNNSMAYCLQKCPEGTARRNQTCVNSCPRTQPFLHAESCLTKCPNSSRYALRNIGKHDKLFFRCVESCPVYVSLVNNLCIDSCSPSEVLFRNICQSQCPVSDPYPVHIPATNRHRINFTTTYDIQAPISALVICAEKCPFNFVLDNDECFADCPNSSKDMVYNRTCFSECPSHHSFVISNGTRKTCVKECNKLHFHMNCVDKCPESHRFIRKKECINCREMGLFQDGNTCAQTCEFLHHDDQCYDICPPKVPFAFNGTCSGSCPETLPMIDKQLHKGHIVSVCVHDCPKYKFISGNHCVSSCPENKRFPVNNRCMSCQDIGKYDDGSKCVDVCPKLHFNFRCVNSCPNLKIFNNTCVRDCPISAPLTNYLNYKRYCVAHCPEDLYIENDYCVFDCAYTSRFLLNKTCVSKCPPDAQFTFTLRGFPYFSSLMIECLTHCKRNHYQHGFTCLERCPDEYNVYKRQCVQTCPKDAPYTYKKACVSVCESVKLGMNCYDKCPEGKYRIKDRCVLGCPYATPYRYQGECIQTCHNYTVNMNCYDQCPSGLIAYKHSCVLECPKQAMFYHNGECLTTCPSDTIVIKTTCFDSCPGAKYEYQRKCIDKCPKLAPYTEDRKCVQSCTNLTDGFRCCNQCPTQKYVFQGKCINECPKLAPYNEDRKCVRSCTNLTDGFRCCNQCPTQKYVFQGKCINECPKLAPYNEDRKCVRSCTNLTDGFHCFKQCPKQKYVFQGKCVKKCPSEAVFINGRSCVVACPFYYDENLFCRKKCPKNYFPHGKQCKTECPSDLPFYKLNYLNEKTCRKECSNYDLAAENKSCIYETDCSGYRDGTWCLSKCHPHSFILRSADKKYCHPLVPIYIAITLLSVIVILNIVFGIRIVCHCYRIRKGENKDTYQLLVDENDDNFGGDILLI